MVAAAVIGGAAVIGAGATVYASSQAADAQKSAAAQASATEQAMYNKTRNDLLPYNQAGQAVAPQLQAMAQKGFNFNPSMADIARTPGYQFNLTQGLQGVQNSAAARGLGNSGAALKGAAGYATGLADSTYQNQFNNALTSFNTNYNALSGVANMGENAAAQTGAQGTQLATQMGQNTIGAGNAQAAAYMAGGNAVSGAANSIGQAYMLNSLTGGGMYNSANSNLMEGAGGLNSGNGWQLAPGGFG